jgi:hypothetical protein
VDSIGPVLGRPEEPPEDVWAHALDQALRTDVESAQAEGRYADLVPDAWPDAEEDVLAAGLGLGDEDEDPDLDPDPETVPDPSPEAAHEPSDHAHDEPDADPDDTAGG